MDKPTRCPDCQRFTVNYDPREGINKCFSIDCSYKENDEQIRAALKADKLLDDSWSVTKCRSVLAHCEPLIRTKVAQEIFDKIDELASDEPVCEEDCQYIEHCEDAIFTKDCIYYQELKAEYGVKD